MAKSARSSDRKRNNANLRARVFGPAHDARTARLSEKLQELAAKPKPESEKAMDVDEGNDDDKDGEDEIKQDVDADVDIDMTGVTVQRKSSRKNKSTHRIEKKNTRQKARNKMVFPTSAAKRKRIAQSKRKSVT